MIDSRSTSSDWSFAWRAMTDRLISKRHHNLRAGPSRSSAQIYPSFADWCMTHNLPLDMCHHNWAGTLPRWAGAGVTCSSHQPPYMDLLWRVMHCKALSNVATEIQHRSEMFFSRMNKFYKSPCSQSVWCFLQDLFYTRCAFEGVHWKDMQ